MLKYVRVTNNLLLCIIMLREIELLLMLGSTILYIVRFLLVHYHNYWIPLFNFDKHSCSFDFSFSGPINSCIGRILLVDSRGLAGV